MVKIINEILYSKKPLRNKVSRFRIFFFGKFTKFWNHKIFDLVAFAKVNYREDVQFFGLDSYFSQKLFFSPKFYNTPFY